MTSLPTPAHYEQHKESGGGLAAGAANEQDQITQKQHGPTTKDPDHAETKQATMAPHQTLANKMAHSQEICATMSAKTDLITEYKEQQGWLPEKTYDIYDTLTDPQQR